MSDIPVTLTIVKEWLQQISPDEQSIPYHVNQWARRFGDDTDFAAIVERYPRHLTRRNVAELAREAHEEGGDFAAVRRLFLAAMMWGYGTIGYGPYRTQRMLEDERVRNVLPHTFNLVLSGTLAEAYEAFQLKMCGPALVTTYFYFIGLGCHLHPMPLILDTVVANSLETLLDLDIAPFAKVTRDKEYETVTSIKPYARGYQHYVQSMNGWADALACRADAIEYYLFDQKLQLSIASEVLADDYAYDSELTIFTTSLDREQSYDSR